MFTELWRRLTDVMNELCTFTSNDICDTLSDVAYTCKRKHCWLYIMITHSICRTQPVVVKRMTLWLHCLQTWRVENSDFNGRIISSSRINNNVGTEGWAGLPVPTTTRTCAHVCHMYMYVRCMSLYSQINDTVINRHLTKIGTQSNGRYEVLNSYNRNLHCLA